MHARMYTRTYAHMHARTHARTYVHTGAPNCPLCARMHALWHWHSTVSDALFIFFREGYFSSRHSCYHLLLFTYGGHGIVWSLILAWASLLCLLPPAGIKVKKGNLGLDIECGKSLYASASYLNLLHAQLPRGRLFLGP